VDDKLWLSAGGNRRVVAEADAGGPSDYAAIIFRLGSEQLRRAGHRHAKGQHVGNDDHSPANLRSGIDLRLVGRNGGRNQGPRFIARQVREPADSWRFGGVGKQPFVSCTVPDAGGAVARFDKLVRIRSVVAENRRVSAAVDRLFVDRRRRTFGRGAECAWAIKSQRAGSDLPMGPRGRESLGEQCGRQAARAAASLQVARNARYPH